MRSDERFTVVLAHGQAYLQPSCGCLVCLNAVCATTLARRSGV